MTPVKTPENNVMKSFKPRVVISPSKIFPWLEAKAKIWYMHNYEKWNCAITIDGMDYQEFGDTRQGAVQNMGNRILNSPYLTAMVPDEAIK
jgi:hypothetical protein